MTLNSRILRSCILRKIPYSSKLYLTQKSERGKKTAAFLVSKSLSRESTPKNRKKKSSGAGSSAFGLETLA